MSLELSRVVSRILSEGYQLEPAAFEFLSTLPPEVDLQSLVDSVMRRKLSEKSSGAIKKNDFDSLVSVGGAVGTTANVPRGVMDSELEIISDPTPLIAPAEADDGFKALFLDRYKQLLGIARRRPDVKNTVALDAVRSISRKDKVKIAGLIASRSSRKGVLEMVLDDPTGSARVVVRDEEMVKSALKAPLDSLIIVEGTSGGRGRFYADSVLSPDVPSRRSSTSSHQVYAALLSDLHIGSKMFLEEDFERFLRWLNGELGDSEIVSHIKYVVIAGDVIDGVGVYPGQEFQLAEKSLQKQFAMASRLISRIPKDMDIIISPGNHDPVRQALPQPAITEDFAADLYKMSNVRMIGGPSYVKLHGVVFLIYHGRSLDDIIATIPDLSYDKPAAAMQVLLKARHLAPMYGKRTALSPELRDMLTVDMVPDVFHSGHVHTVDTMEYRGTLMVNSGTWQAQTPFQSNMGIEPTPSIVPLVDLSTLEVIKRSFTKSSFALSSG